MSDERLTDARKKINEVDEKMAKLFEKRMDAATEIAEYKKEKGLPIFDESREKEVIKNNTDYIESEDYKEYYADFIQSVMDISKKYQSDRMEGGK